MSTTELDTARRLGTGLDLTFLVPSRQFPVGGVLAMYEYATALLEFGHSVRIVHVDAFGALPTPPDRLTHLFEFDARIVHEVIDRFDGDVDGGDFVFCFDERRPTLAGLPVMWVQSAGILAWKQEREIYSAPCPKVCGSSWLKHVARALGNPDAMTIKALPGLDHQRFRSERPVRERSKRALMVYGPHPAKGATIGVRALRLARREYPDLQATLYGTAPRPPDLPGWITYLHDPPQPQRAAIYNDHRCFIVPSRTEGFGMTGIESQACGTPLIVTANGGSADYAHHEIDALVSQPGDVETMAAHVVAVMTDDVLAERLTSAGETTASGFTWARSAEIIDGLLHRYLRDPDPYRRPVSAPANPKEAGVGFERMRQDFYAGRTAG